MNNLKYSHTELLKIIIVSIIPFLIWGPFFPDLIVTVSASFFLFYIWKSKDFYYLNNSPFIIFFFFCIFIVICSLNSDDIEMSLKSSLFYFRIGVFSCFLWYLIDKDQSILTYFYYTLILCFSILVFDGYFQYFNGENLIGLKIQGIRASSFFGDELIMGSYLSRLFPLLFALFLVKEKKRFEIYFIGLLFILVDVLIYLSAERSAFFALNLSTIFIILLIKQFQKFRLITFILSSICIIIISFNSSALLDRMFLSPAKDMKIFNNLTQTSESDTQTSESDSEIVLFTPMHDSHLRTAINMFKDKPFLGHGPKMFRIKCSDTKYSYGLWPCSTHPHNFYIQLLAETGIIGFLFLSSALIYVFYMALRQLMSIIFGHKRPLNDYEVCLLAGILITVWPVTPNGNFFTNWLMIVYSLPVGLYLQSIYSKKIQKKRL